MRSGNDQPCWLWVRAITKASENIRGDSPFLTKRPVKYFPNIVTPRIRAREAWFVARSSANIIAQFRKDAGIERNITPHMLRHTVATLLLRNGVDIRVVQEFLGHASIATTQRYTHVAKEHLIGVLRKSHPSLGLRMKA